MGGMAGCWGRFVSDRFVSADSAVLCALNGVLLVTWHGVLHQGRRCYRVVSNMFNDEWGWQDAYVLNVCALAKADARCAWGDVPMHIIMSWGAWEGITLMFSVG